VCWVLCVPCSEGPYKQEQFIRPHGLNLEQVQSNSDFLNAFYYFGSLYDAPRRGIVRVTRVLQVEQERWKQSVLCSSRPMTTRSIPGLGGPVHCLSRDQCPVFVMGSLGILDS
jgi:hypothetical protein